VIGLGTYAYFWRRSSMSLEEMVADAAALGADVFQICDYPAIEDYPGARLDALAGAGPRLELGTRGIDHLDRYLRLALRLNASLVRTMLPALDGAAGSLAEALPRYADAGVTLALETYEKVPTAGLVALVEELAHPNLGICLDPANCVANLELPRDVVDATAPHVKNLHVKDFRFGRDEGWVGFRLAGCPLGEGQLDVEHLFARVRPADRGISQIVEHWLPWQGDEATTVDTERRWTEHNLAYLRRI
jgi:sugar phosphate isomerase/epimerase